MRMFLPYEAPLNMPQPGTIIELPPHAIYLGSDALRLKLERVGDGKPVHPSQEWVTIEGHALNDDDSPRGYRSTLVDVRELLRLADGQP